MFYDLRHLPPFRSCDVQRFTADYADTAGAGLYIPWRKPQGVTMCLFMLAAGGGGGGAGWGDAAGTSRRSGGGGASSAWVVVQIPALFVPNYLGWRIGRGGAAGVQGVANGQPGIQSSIIYDHGQPSNNSITCSPGVGGTNATAIAVGSGGAPTTANARISYLGFGCLFSSDAGGGGSSGSLITPINPTWTFPFTGGAGGGGVQNTNTAFAGANVTALGGGQIETFPFPKGGAIQGGNGEDGWYREAPFFAMGGAGGAGNTGGAGGVGGRGGKACGGGGGGAGTPDGGDGGKGGDGFGIAISW
jgi:hypothetical protein